MSQLGTYNFTSIETLTGNLGGAVYPIASNVNLVGAGGIVVTGDPTTATLTFAVAGIASTYTTDAGNAVPALGVLTVAGGTNIGTTGAGSTVTINLDGTTNHCVQIGNAGGSITSMAVGATGETIMGATGADPGWTGSPTFSGTATAGTGLTATTGAITASAGNVIITAGNLTLPNTIVAGTNGVISFGGVKWINNFGTNNTFVGGNSGNLGLTVGTTQNNTAIGFNTMLAIDGAMHNAALGASALIVLIAGDNNTACGDGALDQVTSGSNNIGLGYNAGHDATVASSSNIFIGNAGAAESNTIRIGTQGGGAGQQDKAYCAGIYGASSAAATTSLVTVDSVGKLGATALATNGQVLIGSTGAAPVWAAPTSTGGTITVTSGAGSLNFDVVTGGGGLVWSEETGAAVALAADHGYVMNRATIITATLPAVCAARTIISLVGLGAGLYTIAQNAGQVIHFYDVDTTVGVGGSITAINRYGCIELICVVANNEWVVRSSVGNFTIV